MTIRKFFLILYGAFFILLISLGCDVRTFISQSERSEAQSGDSLQSYLLANELRQNSDDLTRFARTYVVTGNPKYEDYYNRIIANP